MKKQAFLLLLLSLGYTLLSTAQITEKDLKKILEQELANQQRAKTGNTDVISVIADSMQVKKLKEEISLKIEKRRRAEQEAEKNKSLSERYKSGDKTSVPEMINVIKSADREAKDELYYGLDKNYDDPEDYSIQDADLAAAILSNIEKPDDEEAVIQLAGITRMHGYVPAFEKRLLSGKSKDEGRLVYWLGEEGSSMPALEYVRKKILDRKVNLSEESWYMTGLEGFSESKDEMIRNVTYNLCLEIYNRKLIPKSNFEELGKTYYSANPASALLDILLTLGDEKVIPIANDLVKKDLRSEKALCALIRLEGVKHKELLFTFLRDKEKFFDSLEPAQLLYKSTKDESIVTELLLQYEKRRDYAGYLNDRIINTLVDMGAQEYIGKLNTILTNKGLVKSLEETYTLSKMTIEYIAEDIYTMGLIAKPFDKDKIITAKQKNPDNSPVYNLLLQSGIHLWFDAETGFVPVDYDHLIQDFINNSNNKLSDCIVWMDAEGAITDEVIQYRITLIANNKAYIATPEDIGDWYDMDVVLTIVNTLAKNAGLKERFISIDTGDQTVQVLFGQEEKVKQFAEKYKL